MNAERNEASACLSPSAGSTTVMITPGATPKETPAGTTLELEEENNEGEEEGDRNDNNSTRRRPRHESSPPRSRRREHRDIVQNLRSKSVKCRRLSGRHNPHLRVEMVDKKSLLRRTKRHSSWLPYITSMRVHHSTINQDDAFEWALMAIFDDVNGAFIVPLLLIDKLLRVSLAFGSMASATVFTLMLAQNTVLKMHGLISYVDISSRILRLILCTMEIIPVVIVWTFILHYTALCFYRCVEAEMTGIVHKPAFHDTHAKHERHSSGLHPHNSNYLNLPFKRSHSCSAFRFTKGCGDKRFDPTYWCDTVWDYAHKWVFRVAYLGAFGISYFNVDVAWIVNMGVWGLGVLVLFFYLLEVSIHSIQQFWTALGHYIFDVTAGDWNVRQNDKTSHIYMIMHWLTRWLPIAMVIVLSVISLSRPTMMILLFFSSYWCINQILCGSHLISACWRNARADDETERHIVSCTQCKHKKTILREVMGSTAVCVTCWLTAVLYTDVVHLILPFGFLQYILIPFCLFPCAFFTYLYLREKGNYPGILSEHKSAVQPLRTYKMRILLTWGINALYVGFFLTATYLFFTCNLIGQDAPVTFNSVKGPRHRPAADRSTTASLFKPFFRRIRSGGQPHAPKSFFSYSSSSAHLSSSEKIALGRFEHGHMRYPVCDKKWNGLDILDMGFLAELAYHENMTDSRVLEAKLAAYFPAHSKISWDSVEAQHGPRHFSVRIRHEDFSEACHVISLSGTNRLRDVYEDVAIWNEAGVLRLISMLIPIEWWWHSHVVASLVSMASWLFFEPRYVDDMARSVMGLRRGVSEPVIFTGHSLGGGVAAILGAKTPRSQSVGFGSPGASYQSAKFGFDLRDLRLTSTTIIADRDIVPMIDSHAGSVQAVQCDASKFWQCHDFSRLLCELQSSCMKMDIGGVGSHYWNARCAHREQQHISKGDRT